MTRGKESAWRSERKRTGPKDAGKEPQQPKARVDTETIKVLVESLDRKGKETLAAELVRDVLPTEANKAVVAEAVKTAPEGVEGELAAEAMRVASPDARKAAISAAVESTSRVNKEDLVSQAMWSLPSEKAREKVAREFLPSQAVADDIWRTVVQAFKWVLWGATIALVAAIGVSLFREVDQAYVQILLTVFTTVACIFAGFISGKALGNTTGG